MTTSKIDPKVKTARLSIFSNLALIIGKLVVGIISGSVSIISEAIHSGMDLVAAIIAFISVKISGKPPDEEHPYGHGKFENVSGVIEAILIFVAAIWIIYEAVKKISSEEKIESAWLGFIVMMISAIVNYFVSKKLYKTAKETDSIALEADALHLKTDVITSLGVAVGLLLIWITDIPLLDPIVAICVALFILKESWELLLKAYKPLLDTKLSANEIADFEEIIHTHGYQFHDLKTRKAGSNRFLEFHLVMEPDTTVEIAHNICDSIEEQIKNKYNGIHITIHVETPEMN